jgi:hypothetical protein
VARPLDLDELVDHFTLDGDEHKLLLDKEAGEGVDKVAA